MTATRELNIKPSCAHEIHAFPADQAAQLWDKIARLVDDPIPDGKLKKKLKGKGRPPRRPEAAGARRSARARGGDAPAHAVRGGVRRRVSRSSGRPRSPRCRRVLPQLPAYPPVFSERDTRFELATLSLGS